MDTLMDMPNVGPVLERNLLAIGIETPEQLMGLGSREAFTRIRASVDPDACLHMLYGLEGAVRGIPDKELPRNIRDELKAFYQQTR